MSCIISTVQVVPKFRHLTRKIWLSTTKWTFPFELKFIAFDLTTNDFLNAEKKSIPGRFYYLRQGNEFQMEIVRKDSNVTVISLSREITRIDLDPGEYFLEIVSPSGRLSKKMVIK